MVRRDSKTLTSICRKKRIVSRRANALHKPLGSAQRSQNHEWKAHALGKKAKQGVTPELSMQPSKHGFLVLDSLSFMLEKSAEVRCRQALEFI